MKIQAECPHSLPKFLEEPFGIVTILEADHKVVGVSDDVDFSSGVHLPPRMSPRVQDIMQEHIRE